MKFSKKILETFVDLPNDWRELMESVGLEVKSFDGLDIMNLELLANRGDHYCYEGLAREICGRIGTGNRIYLHGGRIDVDGAGKGFVKDSDKLRFDNSAGLFDLETEKCIAYALTPFALKSKRKSRETADGYIREMLPASGVNLILDVIDITNVLLLESGQPAHAYDADKIVGKVRVRESRPGEEASLLFREGLTELPVGTCVIADDEKVLCVGGVIGCRGADVDEGTRNILLETALFDPASIREAERSLLEKPTIAAQIFERGGNIGAIVAQACRAKKLYKDIGWEQSGDIQFAQWLKQFRPPENMCVKLSGDLARSALEIEISDEEITERLSRYGFDKSRDGMGYIVPEWRHFNMKCEPAELVEQLAVSIGYDNLPSKLPAAEIGAAPTSEELRKEEINSYLVHNGFYEVFADDMYSPKHAALSPAGVHIALENSVDGGYAFMKNNSIVQAAELVEKNLRVKNSEIRVFEWGKVFQMASDGAPVETSVLWGVLNGAKESPLTAKGLLGNLGADLNLPFEIRILNADDFAAKACLKHFHPKRAAEIVLYGESICVFGEIHPLMLAELDIKNAAPVFFEFFDAEKLLRAPKKAVAYESPGATIPSVRDVSIAVPYGKAAGDVAARILRDYPIVVAARITDVYDKPKESLRNVTFSLTFSDGRGAEELNKIAVEIAGMAA